MTAPVSPLTAGRAPTVRPPLVLRPRSAAALVVALAIAFDRATYHGHVGLGLSAFTLTLAMALAHADRARMLAPVSLALIAPWFSLRSSIVLSMLDIAAVVCIAIIWAGLEPAVPTRLVDSGRAVLRMIVVPMIAPWWGVLLARALALRPYLSRPRVGAALRALLVAVPLVSIVLWLLASADAVLASFLHPPKALDRLPVHLLLAAIGGYVGLCVLVRAQGGAEALIDTGAARPTWMAKQPHFYLSVAFWSVGAAIAAFATSSVLAALQGRDYVMRRTGLTYAEYARRGYFQLLAVAGIVIVLLVLGDRTVQDRTVRGGRTLRLGAAFMAGATGFVLASALKRLSLYSDAFGYTMLRLWCVVAALWIAVVLVVAIVRLLPGTGRFARLSTAVAACTVGAIVSFNAIDPEGLVARHNIAARANGRVDLLYLAALSDDADRALFARLDRLSAEERAQAVGRLCTEPREERVFWAWNRSAARVLDLQRNSC